MTTHAGSVMGGKIEVGIGNLRTPGTFAPRARWFNGYPQTG